LKAAGAVKLMTNTRIMKNREWRRMLKDISRYIVVAAIVLFMVFLFAAALGAHLGWLLPYALLLLGAGLILLAVALAREKVKGKDEV